MSGLQTMNHHGLLRTKQTTLVHEVHDAVEPHEHTDVLESPNSQGITEQFSSTCHADLVGIGFTLPKLWLHNQGASTFQKRAKEGGQ